MKLTLIVGVAGIASVAMAVDGVVPNAYAATEGPGTFALTTNTAGGRTYQYVIDESQLTSFVGTNLESMALRLNSSASWPPFPVSMSFFDVYIGAGVDPSAISATFADNFTGGITQVRNGSLSFNPGDFPSGNSPNAFGPNIDFNMTSYAYSGGDLSIMMRFDTQVVTGGTAGGASFDALLASDPNTGYGTLFAGKWTGNSAGTSGSNANFLVTQLNASPVPEPATMVAFGVGALALARRRRSKA